MPRTGLSSTRTRRPIPPAPRSTPTRGGTRCNRRAPGCWSAPRPSASAVSNTGWLRSTRRATSSGRLCCGTTSGRHRRSRAVVDHLGGPQACADAIGSVPAASFTVTKLRWMAENEPDNARRTASVLLPHDWLTWMLGGRADMTTDHGDASGTGYYSPRQPAMAARAGCAGRWAGTGRPSYPASPTRPRPWDAPRPAHCWPPEPATTWPPRSAWASPRATSPCRSAPPVPPSAVPTPPPPTPAVPSPASPTPPADTSPWYAPSMRPGSSRSSAPFSASTTTSSPTWRWPAPPGANGLTLLPYLDGERTPNRPDATGVFVG